MIQTESYENLCTNFRSDRFFTYREVKSSLLLGRHVEAIMVAEACDNTEWLAGHDYHYGHRIENFAVLNDGKAAMLKIRLKKEFATKKRKYNRYENIKRLNENRFGASFKGPKMSLWFSTTQTCTEEYRQRPRSGTRSRTSFTPTGLYSSTEEYSLLATGSTNGLTLLLCAHSASPCNFLASDVSIPPFLNKLCDITSIYFFKGSYSS